jgi:hypothetical protein
MPQQPAAADMPRQKFINDMILHIVRLAPRAVEPNFFIHPETSKHDCAPMVRLPG